MNTIVLVHGAWMDASAWNKVVPLLEAAGNEVININLPGHGSDNTSYDKITLQSYVDAVKNAIGTKTNIILVGHSMAGLVISQTAEEIPGQISKLIYLGAYLPRNGETLLQLGNQDKESILGKFLKPDGKTGSATIAKEGIIATFASDVPQEDADRLVANHKPDALAPFDTPASLTDANFGKVQKIYIYTVNDKAIGYKLQQTMVKNSNVSNTYSLNSSHSPFLSIPGELSDIIIKEAK